LGQARHLRRNSRGFERHSLANISIDGGLTVIERVDTQALGNPPCSVSDALGATTIFALVAFRGSQNKTFSIVLK
jgi:hypothetical protein